MRVSPIGWAFDTIEETLAEAKRSAEVTHNHPEGIKGAQATAAAIFLARRGKTKDDIKNYIEETFGYNLHRTLNEIRPQYMFKASCQETVPEAIIAFLESYDFKSAIQNAISLGGDADTLACITGSIAEAFYREIPEEMVEFARRKIKPEMKHLLDKFYKIVFSNNETNSNEVSGISKVQKPNEFMNKINDYVFRFLPATIITLMVFNLCFFCNPLIRFHSLFFCLKTMPTNRLIFIFFAQ